MNIVKPKAMATAEDISQDEEGKHGNDFAISPRRAAESPPRGSRVDISTDGENLADGRQI